MWPLITEYVNNKSFKKFDNKIILKTITEKWILGAPFYELFQIANDAKCKIGKGKRPRKVKIETVIDICEGGIAYEGNLLISALFEFLDVLNIKGVDNTIKRLQIFQKRLKYGLPTPTTIALYELGFSDRVIAQDLATKLKLTVTQKKELVKALKRNQTGAMTVIEEYPQYFQERMTRLFE